MARLNLDLSKVELERPRVDILPEGEYEVEVVSADVKDTRGGGSMLVLMLEVVAGNMAGATIQDRLNIVNKNPKAQDIANQRLKTIATLIGHPNPSKIADTDELLGKRAVKAKVIVDEYEGTDGLTYKSNVIKYYNAIPGQAQVEVVAPSVEKAAPAPAATTGKRPWNTK